MKYSDSILDSCIARVHAQVLHEQALKGKPLPDFSPQRSAERQAIRNRAQGEKFRASLKAKGATR